jgi:hypothetical protein
MASLDDVRKRRPVRGRHGNNLQRVAIAVVIVLSVLFAFSGKGFGYTSSTSFGSSVSLRTYEIPLLNPQAITIGNVETLFQFPYYSSTAATMMDFIGSRCRRSELL